VPYRALGRGCGQRSAQRPVSRLPPLPGRSACAPGRSCSRSRPSATRAGARIVRGACASATGCGRARTRESARGLLGHDPRREPDGVREQPFPPVFPALQDGHASRILRRSDGRYSSTPARRCMNSKRTNTHKGVIRTSPATRKQMANVPRSIPTGTDARSCSRLWSSADDCNGRERPPFASALALSA
jgi:hypothetical protein